MPRGGKPGLGLWVGPLDGLGCWAGTLSLEVLLGVGWHQMKASQRCVLMNHGILWGPEVLCLLQLECVQAWFSPRAPPTTPPAPLL